MIHVIGIGIDGKGSLTKKAMGIVIGAGLLVGGRRHLEEFPDVKARRLAISGGLEKVSEGISAFLKGGKGHVAVLATGDPSLYGIGDFIIRKFGPERVNIIPNVSTVQEAFARIKENSNGVSIISAHGRSADLSGLAEEIRGCEKAAVFTDPGNTPGKIAKELLKDTSLEFRCFVAEELGAKKERIIQGTLGDIAKVKRFAPLNILILIRKDKPATRPVHVPGIPDNEFFHSSGMITKEEIRVVSLSKLGLSENSIVWDIGAGSGSVGIEAALIARRGKVFAFEKNKGRVKDIRRNIEKFGLSNFEVVEGEAPECIKKAIPAPDAVFVGGGGKGLESVLEYVEKKVNKGASVVVNAVTFESAACAFGFLARKGWTREAVIVNLSRTKEAGGLNMLSAHNPVFIITGKKL